MQQYYILICREALTKPASSIVLSYAVIGFGGKELRIWKLGGKEGREEATNARTLGYFGIQIELPNKSGAIWEADLD